MERPFSWMRDVSLLLQYYGDDNDNGDANNMVTG
jgi:hypothetical protein